jgi:hypothetical protein
MAKAKLDDIDRFAEALNIGDPAYIRRIVIDIQGNEMPIIHVERYADTDQVEVIASPLGAAVARVSKVEYGTKEVEGEVSNG